MLFIALAGDIVISVVGVVDWIDIQNRQDRLRETATSADVSAGAGLILTLIGGVVLILFAGSRLSARRQD